MKNKKIIGIYKLTSPSGKIYIGQSVNLKRRLQRYSTLDCKHQFALYNSIKKYGFNNFVIEILWSSNYNYNYSKILLNLLEKKFIKKYNCISPNGYNLREGGDSSLMSIESRKKMSISRTGLKRNQEICNNISIGKRIKIDQFDLKNNYLKTWNGAKEINEILGYNVANISSCCRHKRNKANNFIWKYNNENDKYDNEK